ncbi:MAG: hypothetical protein A6F71_09675 [Cycloclasticus sp. symbiont of Poecilosclerida sp. M]|nr:MAG: hypothetical protein A6F71_09675 [Cycloclasticus sp. symbiont of Poecilosclerida sp. M]
MVASAKQDALPTGASAGKAPSSVVQAACASTAKTQTKTTAIDEEEREVQDEVLEEEGSDDYDVEQSDSDEEDNSLENEVDDLIDDVFRERHACLNIIMYNITTCDND